MKMSNIPAYANKTTNQIVIDERLREFPKLRRFIIEHEMGHIMDDNTPNDFLKRDMRDYPPLYMRNDYWKFIKKNGFEIYQKHSFLTALQMSYYNSIRIVFVAPLTAIIVISAYFGRWIKRKRFK